MLSEKYIDGNSQPPSVDHALWREASGSENYGFGSFQKVSASSRKSSFPSTSNIQASELYTLEDLQRILAVERKTWQDDIYHKMREEFGHGPSHANQES